MINLDHIESLAKAAEKEHLNVPNLDFCLIDVLVDEFEKAGRFQKHRSLNAIIRFAAYGAALNPQVVLELIAEVRRLSGMVDEDVERGTLFATMKQEISSLKAEVRRLTEHQAANAEIADSNLECIEEILIARDEISSLKQKLEVADAVIREIHDGYEDEARGIAWEYLQKLNPKKITGEK